MNQYEANLLVDLYNLMNNLPKGRILDMATWIKKSSNQKITEKKAVTCGTACCAAGWGVLSLPSWQRKFKVVSYISNFISNEYNYKIINKLTKYLLSAKDFGIYYSEFEYMFMPCMYSHKTKITPKLVAKHIKTILSHYQYSLI